MSAKVEIIIENFTFVVMIAKILLSPYYLVLNLRHLLYDKGLIRSYRYNVPIISVGNITVGGTGKTPHAELIIRHLLEVYPRVALISRGYGRKTSGFRLVKQESSSKEVGDEPLQIKRKFPSVTVAVDSSRKRAIETLLAFPQDKRPSIIVLDDAFQHRKIIPSTSIVLVDYNRPIFKDTLLPIGRLRDLPRRISAADIVIVTKLPWYDDNPDETLWRKKLHLKSSQKLYFSRVEYCGIHPVFSDEGDPRYIYSPKAVLFSGIASNRSFVDYINANYHLEGIFKFPDHKNYNKFNIRRIESLAQQFPTSAIITTEKDAQRLRDLPFLSENFKKRLMYLEIKVVINS